MSAVRALKPTIYAKSIDRIYPFTIQASGSAPVLLGQLPNISIPFVVGNVNYLTTESGDYLTTESGDYLITEDSGLTTYSFDLSVYFSGATSYSISPAVEPGWSFDEDTGILTIDMDDTGTFGPYTVTGINDNGSTPGNTFVIYIVISTGRRHRMRFGFGHGF